MPLAGFDTPGSGCHGPRAWGELEAQCCPSTAAWRPRGGGGRGGWELQAERESEIRVEGRPPSEEAVSTTEQGACRTGGPGKTAVTLVALMCDQIQEGPQMFFFLSFPYCSKNTIFFRILRLLIYTVGICSPDIFLVLK